MLDLILLFYNCIQKKTEINYGCVEAILSDYEKLQVDYNGVKETPEVENLTWRDDYKFLFELCESCKVFKASELPQKIRWRKLPSLPNARWNSRATFALIAYFLLPDQRQKMEKICGFITAEWAEAWFSNQHHKMSRYQDLLSAITQLACPKALKCFQTYWVDAPSVIEVARSNVVAERGVKTMEDIIKKSKHDKYLSVKFINSNLNI